MTISSTTAKNTYAGNGSTTVFAYTFRILAEAEILVQIKVDATDVITTQTLTTDYTVSGVGDSAGGNITMIVAPATGETLILTRNTALLQEIDYTENDAFPADTHETGLDRLTTITQQIDEEVDRSVKVDAAISGFDGTLPTPVADQFIKFDSAATGLEAFTLSTTAGLGNIVEDLSPQLGGDLQTNGQDIDVATGDKITLVGSSSITMAGTATMTYADGTSTAWNGTSTAALNGTSSLTVGTTASIILAGAANINMTGTSTITVGTGSTFIFEGSTADAFETTLDVVDPTADRTIKLPNVSETLSGTSTLNAYIEGFQMTHNVSDENHDMDFDVGVAVDSSTDVVIRNTNTQFTKLFDVNWVAGDGNGGMASGGAGLTNDGTVHLFVISKADGTVDFIGDDNIAGTNISADVSGGGYVNVALVQSILLNSSANIVEFNNVVSGTLSTVKYANGKTEFNATPVATESTITVAIPAGLIILAHMACTMNGNSTSATQARIYDVAGNDATVSASTNATVSIDGDGSTNTISNGSVDVFTNTSAQLKHKSSATTATSLRIYTLGYTLYR